MSMVFTPFYLPLVGLAALFIFSYMSLMPWQYKLTVLLMVYVFTILFPTLLIHAYRNYQGWSRLQLGMKERRLVPYVIAIICYFACYFVMVYLHIPQFMANILVATHHTDRLCHHQCLVEGVDPHGRHRWFRRSPAGFLHPLCVQSAVVVQHHPHHCRHGRHQPHDSAPTLTVAGGCRLSHRHGGRLLGYHIIRQDT